jgi:hypothetical protein
MSRILASMFVAAAILSPLSVQAFGLPGIPGLGTASPGASSTDLSGSQDQLVTQYVGANKEVLNANSKMADALGLKEAAETARAAAGALTTGATKDGLKDGDKASSMTTEAIAAAEKNPPVMDAKAKATYASGLASLGIAVVKYVGMKQPLSQFQSGLSSVSPMMLPKLQSGAYIVSSFPTNLTNLTSALSGAISFAKAHDIAVPLEATNAI